MLCVSCIVLCALLYQDIIIIFCTFYVIYMLCVCVTYVHILCGLLVSRYNNYYTHIFIHSVLHSMNSYFFFYCVQCTSFTEICR